VHIVHDLTVALIFLHNVGSQEALAIDGLGLWSLEGERFLRDVFDVGSAEAALATTALVAAIAGCGARFLLGIGAAANDGEGC
jgi:hypothetical protein